MRYLYSILCIICLIFTSCQKQPLLSVEELEKIQEEIIEKHENNLDRFVELSHYYGRMDKLAKAQFGFSLFKEMNARHWLTDISDQFDRDILDYIDYTINYYTEIKDYQALLISYIYKSYKFNRELNYSKATHTLLEALDADKTKQYPHQRGTIYHQLAHLYKSKNELEKTIENCNLAIEQYELSDNPASLINIPQAQIILGWTYKTQEKYNDAIQVYQHALELTNDSITQGDLYLNIGESYNMLGKTDSALFYLYEGLKYPYLESNIVPRFYEIAKAYNILNQMDSAYAYMDKAFEYPMNIYFEITCYGLLLDMATKTNDPRILKYKYAYDVCNDSIKKINRQPSPSITEQIYMLDKQTIQAKKERIQLIIILGTLSLFCIIIILWLSRKQKIKKREANVYRQKLEYKEDILNNQHKEFEEKHQQTILKLNNELKRTKEKYALERAKGNYQQRMKIDKTIFNEVLNIEDEEAFTIKMNHILNNLPDKLKMDYPDITFKEIAWCCLFILELPTSEIAFILDYKQTSLYKFKQRLTKKLHFATTKDLEQMLYNKVNLYI